MDILAPCRTPTPAGILLALVADARHPQGFSATRPGEVAAHFPPTVFDRVAERRGSAPPVIEAEDVRIDPAGVLPPCATCITGYCHTV